MSASSSGNDAAKAKKIVGILKSRFGEIPWWPGDTDEVMIGAILTQQTRWENVVRALDLLKERGLCSMQALYSADLPVIEDAVQCTGFYRIKARRLKALAVFVVETCGGVAMMAHIPTPDAPGRASRGARDWRRDGRQYPLLRFFPAQFCDRCLYGTHCAVCRYHHPAIGAQTPF